MLFLMASSDFRVLRIPATLLATRLQDYVEILAPVATRQRGTEARKV
jgi:hypothetical protein